MTSLGKTTGFAPVLFHNSGSALKCPLYLRNSRKFRARGGISSINSICLIAFSHYHFKDCYIVGYINTVTQLDAWRIFIINLSEQNRKRSLLT